MTLPPSEFAQTIREARVRAGLSQEELAERAGVSTRAVSDMERGLRRNPRPETLRLIAEALALGPEDRARFFASAHAVPDDLARSNPRERSDSGALAMAVTVPSRPLPQPLDALIGREREIAAIVALFASDQARLVTLTGPGGVGKTRLSLAIASSIAADYPDGAIFVELGPLTNATQMLPAIANAVWLRETGDRPLIDVLIGFFGARRYLLILDNFEHLMPAAAEVAALVRECPNLQILGTSREPLRVRGEREVQVAPLAVPNRDQPASLEELGANDAVALFMSRANNVRADFRLDQTNAPHIAEICRQLDGLPLAIELAAARIRLLSPAALLDRLGRRLGLLTEGARDAPYRHQTLRNTIAWSYDLLSPVEQTVFRRTSVFVNGFTLDGAGVVANIPGSDPFDIITSLVEKNLLNASQMPTGETRFSMLESIRAFGIERLEEHGELATVRQSHLEYVVARNLRLDDDGDLLELDDRWLGQMDVELDDVRSALRWAQQTNDSTALLRLAVAVGSYWVYRPYTLEEVSLLAAAIEFAHDATVPLQVVSRFFAGAHLGWAGDLNGGFAIAETTLRIANVEGDVLLQGIAHFLNGGLWEVSGDCEQSAQAYRRAVEALRPPPESLWFYGAMGELGDRLVVCGDIDEAVASLETAGTGYPAFQSLNGLAVLPAQRAHAEIVRGHLDLARTLLFESIGAARAIGDVRIELGAVLGFASIELELGDPEQAARIIGVAQRERESHGLGRDPAHPLWNGRTDARVRAALGVERYRACVQEGRLIPYGQLLSELLPETETAGSFTIRSQSNRVS
jgi:predicted ATPase/transcriptional regulator with XRE-family HTH domain